METITRPTVFILGAGASVPYGYPTGAGLVDLILNKPLGPDTTLDCAEYRDFKDALGYSPDDSVDAFLEKQPGLEPIGKRAIAEWLIRCETPDSLKRRSDGTDWYRHFFKTQLSGLPFEHLSTFPFKFITFDYDRTLEQALYGFVFGKHGHGRSKQEIDGMCTAIIMRHIVHVHGLLGAMAWDVRNEKPAREYAPTITPEHVQQAADQIKIMHEKELAQSTAFDTAHQWLTNAERMYFLGFGFHSLNLMRLHRGTRWNTLMLPTGTAYAVNKTTKAEMEARLGSVGDRFPYVQLRNPDCDIIQFLDGIQGA